MLKWASNKAAIPLPEQAASPRNVAQSVDSAIRRLRLHGKNDREIADHIASEYGIAYDSADVFKRAHLLKQLPSTKCPGGWTWAQDEALCGLVASGMTATEIAPLLSSTCRPDTSRNAVIGRAYRLELRFRHNNGVRHEEAEPLLPEPAPKPTPKIRQKESFPNQCRSPRCTNTRAIPYEECIPCREKIRLAKKVETSPPLAV